MQIGTDNLDQLDDLEYSLVNKGCKCDSVFVSQREIQMSKDYEDIFYVEMPPSHVIIRRLIVECAEGHKVVFLF